MADQMDQERGAQANSSNMNTLLLVVIIAAAVILAGWWFMGRGQAPVDETQNGIDVEVTLPDAETPDDADTTADSQ
ncbi:MAG: hypothetical protein WD883_03005 [Candidatus Colwellbacteria bacterium]